MTKPIRFGWSDHGHQAIEKAVTNNAKYLPVGWYLKNRFDQIREGSKSTDQLDRGPHHYINLKLNYPYQTQEHLLPEDYKNPKHPDGQPMSKEDVAKLLLTRYIRTDNNKMVRHTLSKQFKKYPITPGFLDGYDEKNIFISLNQKRGTAVDQLTALMKTQHLLTTAQNLKILKGGEKLEHEEKRLTLLKNNLQKQTDNTFGRLFHQVGDSTNPFHATEAYDYKTVAKGFDKSTHKFFENSYHLHDPNYTKFLAHASLILGKQPHDQDYSREGFRRDLAKNIQHAHKQHYLALEKDYEARKLFKADIEAGHSDGYKNHLIKSWMPLIRGQMTQAAVLANKLFTGIWIEAERNQWKA